MRWESFWWSLGTVALVYRKEARELYIIPFGVVFIFIIAWDISRCFTINLKAKKHCFTVWPTKNNDLSCSLFCWVIKGFLTGPRPSALTLSLQGFRLVLSKYNLLLGTIFLAPEDRKCFSRVFLACMENLPSHASCWWHEQLCYLCSFN